MSDITKTLIVLGPQGSGKGTQASLLGKKYNYTLVGAGDSLRKIAKEDSELGRKINQTINVEGNLVESEVVAEVIKNRLKRIDPEKPVIIDGFPRTLAQYDLMLEFWPKLKRGDYKVLFIDLSEDEAVKRLSTRFICAGCGEIYMGNREKCEKCGGKLIQRDDDKPEAVRTRLKLFNDETMPMVEKMESEGRVIRVDGAPSIREVHEEIVKGLEL